MVQLFQERPVLGQERRRECFTFGNEEEDSNIQTSNIARYESRCHSSTYWRSISRRYRIRYRGDHSPRREPSLFIEISTRTRYKKKRGNGSQCCAESWFRWSYETIFLSKNYHGTIINYQLSESDTSADQTCGKQNILVSILKLGEPLEGCYRFDLRIIVSSQDLGVVNRFTDRHDSRIRRIREESWQGGGVEEKEREKEEGCRVCKVSFKSVHGRTLERDVTALITQLFCSRDRLYLRHG